MRQFQIGRVIQGEFVLRRQSHRRSPSLTIRLPIHRDRQCGQIFEGSIPESRVGSSPPNPHLQYVGYLQMPQTWHVATPVDDSSKDRGDGVSRLRSINPRQSDRTVQHDAQGRPSSRSAFIAAQSKGPPASAFARERMRSAAACARTRSIPPLLATSLATGLPCRVIKTSSPCSTRSSNAPNVFFASKAPISSTGISRFQLKPA